MNRRQHTIPLDIETMHNIINSKIIMKGSPNFRKYRDVPILHSGTFTDSVSRIPITHTKEVIRKYITNWNNNYVDLDHDIDKCLSRIGWVENPYEKNGVAYADIKLLATPMVKDEVISRIDAGLIGAVSVELYTNDHYKNGKTVVDEILWDGLALVTIGADSMAKIPQ